MTEFSEKPKPIDQDIDSLNTENMINPYEDLSNRLGNHFGEHLVDVPNFIDIENDEDQDAKENDGDEIEITLDDIPKGELDDIDKVANELAIAAFSRAKNSQVEVANQRERRQDETDKATRGEKNMMTVKGLIELLPKAGNDNRILVSTPREALVVATSVLWLQKKGNDSIFYEPYYLAGIINDRNLPDDSEAVSNLILASAKTGEVIEVSTWTRIVNAYVELMEERLHSLSFAKNLDQTYDPTRGKFIFPPLKGEPYTTPRGENIIPTLVPYYREKKRIPREYKKDPKRRVNFSSYGGAIPLRVNYSTKGFSIEVSTLIGKVNSISDNLLEYAGVLDKLSTLAVRFKKVEEYKSIIEETQGNIDNDLLAETSS